MPKFAANLSMMFNEVPFPQRFAAAAKAGFKGVEFLFPYAYTPAEVAGWLKDAGLAARCSTCRRAISPAASAASRHCPGREEEFRARRSDGARIRARRSGTPRIHAMAGLLPAGADRAQHRAIYVDNLRYAARGTREGRA